MVDYSEVFVGMDVSKDRHAVAVAERGCDGEVRYFGEIASDAAAIRRLVGKLERLRRVLAESAWAYRHPAAVGRKKYFATRHLPEDIQEVAWQAQARLTRRYRALTARGKRSTVAVTSVAHELVGFMWAIARMEPAAI